MPVFTGTNGADVITPARVSDGVSARPFDALPSALDDFLHGLAGDDTLDGGGGDDSLLAGRGHDLLIGGDGDDTMRSWGDYGAWNDTMLGGEGDDEFLIGRGFVLVQGGPGDDRVGGESWSPCDARVFGEDGDDIVSLGCAAIIDGGSGNDVLSKYYGSGAIFGGAGDDTLRSFYTGLLEGGDGDDVLSIGRGGGLMYGDAGDDTLSTGVGSPTAYGGDGDDVLFASSDGGRADGGTLKLYGEAGNDTLSDSRADDSLIGGDGDDSLTSLRGVDTLKGGAGDDSYWVGNASAVVIESAGGGRDVVTALAGFRLPNHVEDLILDDDFLPAPLAATGVGNALDNHMVGNRADNRLVGRDGADALDGGAGADVLDGGRGQDTLVGGAGDDSFVFNGFLESAREAPDLILGFDGAGAAVGDLIDVSALDADFDIAGNQAFVFGLVGRSGLTVTNDGTDTLVLGDAFGSTAPDFAIRIQDGAVLASAYTAADFIL